MTDNVRGLAEFELPFRRKAELREVEFDGGLKMLRLVLREGKRITQVDIDAETVTAIAAQMQEWVKEQG